MHTIRNYLAAYAAGETTPSAAMDEVYSRIERHADAAIFITLRSLDEVRAETFELEKRGPQGLPLYGIPIAIKDNIDVFGLPTTAACPEFAYRPEHDATAVARLRAAGAIVIGKTNLDQFATGLVGVRSPYGVPRNTFDSNMVPGGSSSGSAIAVAAGLVPVALGTDTAGSGRVPAGLNNIVGLKPSVGAVPTAGVLPACRSLDCISVFALDVFDAYTVFQVIAGYEATDPFSRPVTIDAPAALPKALRVGVPNRASRRFGGDVLAEAAFDRSVGDIEGLGATLVPVDLSSLFDAAALLYEGAWVAERYQAIRPFIEATPEAMHPVTRRITEQATRFSAADCFAGLYRLAELKRAAAPLWDGIDVLMVPTYPRPHSLADLEADPVGPNSELGTYTNFVNLLDLCALAVPGQFRSDGFPSGTTLIAPADCDGLLASVGVALHQAAGVTVGALKAPLAPHRWPVSSANDAIELVVVGAHLSGLALNAELTSRGGRLLRTVKTRPDYRLFALPGGPPARPGLLRVADGTGFGIVTEVWSLSPSKFGAFIASIPAPLSIGTVRLADGTEPKGFLVESQSTQAARDISDFGGWRAYTDAHAA